ncbi:hypothetical protein [Microbacterium sp.]|uniref:hypothetical protein n=1 Tax=Microbacterium sp. TaxID=51671 RepID=UPI0028118E78|nr:hypothetical protein [Microbacterium sp.]
MTLWQAYSCDAITGKQIDRIPFSAFSYARLLSAGGDGQAAVPLDGTFTKTELRSLLQPLSRMLVLERDGVVEYMGTVAHPPKYVRGQSTVSVQLEDVWARFLRRGGWDHTAPNVEKWETTVTGSLRDHAVAVIRRGRDEGPVLPEMGLPISLPAVQSGSVARTYYGYHVEMVGDVLQDLLDEGLDVYFQPRWISNGDSDWLMRSDIGWSSGVTREFFVTADLSEVAGFSESGDASRVTNNARYVGEGSEVDMLVRSNRNTASPYPLLDKTTQAKNVSDVAQLSAMANQDLTMYGAPTIQWEFSVLGDSPVDVGDTVRLHFDGDPWIPDGWHTRRVVKVAVSVPGPDVKTISVQPAGGA